ncbi:MAG: EAL domain-containing protein [Gammaproteobacteria bacterium]|nr:MAG: EAL domain-containing protein [Gammaproteobacteria bacterium]
MSSKEELYKVLVESVPYGTLFFAYGVCVDANQNALKLLGCDLKQLVGASLDTITGDESTALVDLKLQLKKALMGKRKQLSWTYPGEGFEAPIDIDVVYVTDDGKEMVVMLNSQQGRGEREPAEEVEAEPSAFEDVETTADESDVPQAPPGQEAFSDEFGDDGEQLIVTEDGRIISERRVSDRRANKGRDHYFDGLTSLPNRQMLAESLSDFLESHKNEPVCAAVMMLDLDHFKDINDSWGHTVGDQVIKKIGQALSGLMGGDNMLARMSGDEFVLFIPELSDDASKAAWDAQAIAEKLGEAVASPIFLDGHEVILTASIGIALLTDADTTADRILQYADTAMYEAKRKGRNSIAFFDPCITEKAQRQIGMNTRLRKAMDNHEFVLYIQPQISVETGQLVGGEALLRWMNADKVTNMPSEFIPVLESSGLIVDVGRWVIRTSCEYLRNFIDMGIWQDHMRLGINISPRQFRDPQLIDIVQHSMKSYDIDPSFLNFEVTESLVIEDVDDAIKKMEAIKSLGAMFSIDDFGIGYSSMIYLKRLPFDQLKIDREFIRNIHRDQESRGIVEAIMAVSKQYGLKVTAEGVESQEALDILRELGCHSYQGSHFSMPVPCERFTKLLAA